jgi:ligand-binding SRPBCC domain-containing protein
MKTFEFNASQLLNVTLNEAWDFFSSPKNLVRITPGFLDFKIIQPFDDREIYSGMHINYTVKPLFKIPVKWTTEITSVEKPFMFVDKQLKGPYALWEHTHRFTQKENGVLVEDRVRYALPFGIVGAIAHPLLVKNKIAQIFTFRKNVLEEIFNKVS